jgi:hypothetical protein
MRVQLSVPSSADALGAALEGLVRLDLVLLKEAQGRIPLLYEAGVRYVREARGHEHWRHIGEVLRAKQGDCEDLAAWRAAELRAQGEPARAIATPSGPGRWHAVVKRADGSIEDPSRKLGMGSERIEGGEHMPTIKWTLRKTADGWEGEIVLPVGVTQSLSRARGSSKGQALARAASLASRVAQDPVVRALLPPQVRAGLAATQLLARAARAGKLLSVAKRFRSSPARHLVRALF